MDSPGEIPLLLLVAAVSVLALLALRGFLFVCDAVFTRNTFDDSTESSSDL